MDFKQYRLPGYIKPLPECLSSDDVEYLWNKGAFKIPEIHLRNEIVRCYIDYVHPYMSFLDLKEFLQTKADVPITVLANITVNPGINNRKVTVVT